MCLKCAKIIKEIGFLVQDFSIASTIYNYSLIINFCCKILYTVLDTPLCVMIKFIIINRISCEYVCKKSRTPRVVNLEVTCCLSYQIT